MQFFFDQFWAAVTNQGMYSDFEGTLIFAFSIISTILLTTLFLQKTSEDERFRLISELGYEGYLKHKDLMKTLGIEIL
ncbi:MAG: hypothetical protein HY226_04680 [Candidatus Vogelbacteria bacterium]|nr:hypothetical protein [Candidatus Vogelbacteria bacterium]